MDTKQLYYFTYVAKCLNFTTAANHFFVTQPTICRQINLLEEEIGVRLFDRSTHGVSLTTAGVEFQKYATQILEMAETSVSFIRNLSSDRCQTLKIAIFSSSEDILLHCMSRFSKLHPEIQVSIDILTGNRMMEAINNTEYSFYFLHTKYIEKRSDFNYLYTKSDPCCFAVRQCDAHKVHGQDFSALSKEPFVCISYGNGPILHDLFLQVCRSLKITPQIMGFYNRASATLLSVKMGIGNTILPQGLLRNASDIAVFPIDLPEAKLDSCIAWRKNVHSPEIDTFLDFLTELYPDTRIS